jgi:hypothetical protein
MQIWSRFSTQIQLFKNGWAGAGAAQIPGRTALNHGVPPCIDVAVVRTFQAQSGMLLQVSKLPAVSSDHRERPRPTRHGCCNPGHNRHGRTAGAVLVVCTPAIALAR